MNEFEDRLRSALHHEAAAERPDADAWSENQRRLGKGPRNLRPVLAAAGVAAVLVGAVVGFSAFGPDRAAPADRPVITSYTETAHPPTLSPAPALPLPDCPTATSSPTETYPPTVSPSSVPSAPAPLSAVTTSPQAPSEMPTSTLPPTDEVLSSAAVEVGPTETIYFSAPSDPTDAAPSSTSAPEAPRPATTSREVDPTRLPTSAPLPPTVGAAPADQDGPTETIYSSAPPSSVYPTKAAPAPTAWSDRSSALPSEAPTETPVPCELPTEAPVPAPTEWSSQAQVEAPNVAPTEWSDPAQVETPSVAPTEWTTAPPAAAPTLSPVSSAPETLPTSHR
ncbi:hypothetical protein D1871_20800 [Nakamurella silvestris]|nr:hypothetical protein D1871_20800 [Nakamurella silvestris]